MLVISLQYFIRTLVSLSPHFLGGKWLQNYNPVSIPPNLSKTFFETFFQELRFNKTYPERLACIGKRGQKYCLICNIQICNHFFSQFLFTIISRTLKTAPGKLNDTAQPLPESGCKDIPTTPPFPNFLPTFLWIILTKYIIYWKTNTCKTRGFKCRFLGNGIGWQKYGIDTIFNYLACFQCIIPEIECLHLFVSNTWILVQAA